VQAADRAAIIVAGDIPELDIHKLFLTAEEIFARYCAESHCHSREVQSTIRPCSATAIIVLLFKSLLTRQSVLNHMTANL
jgi:hypothetical protein